MKKVILSAIAVLAFGLTNAQETKFGAKLGLNVATLSSKDSDGIKSKIGLNIGGFAEIKISETFAFQPELLFSMQGAKSSTSNSGSGFSSTSESTGSLNYINIPLMAKYFVIPKLSIEAGPQIGFLLSAKTEFTSSTTFGGTTQTSSDSKDTKEFYKTVDFGLNFGASYDITENIFAGVRYNLGLSDIIKDNTGNSVKNSVFSLNAGYKF
jgi:opacity protein-like surface antigen